jgi:hypothetical protein
LGEGGVRRRARKTPRALPFASAPLCTFAPRRPVGSASPRIVSMATAVVTTGALAPAAGAGGAPPAPAPGGADAAAEAAAQRMQRVDAARRSVYAVGAGQLAWGIIGMFIAFNWISNILTLATGAVAVGAWCGRRAGPGNVGERGAQQLRTRRAASKRCCRCAAVGAGQLAWGQSVPEPPPPSHVAPTPRVPLPPPRRRSLADANRFFDRNQPSCCDPVHTKGLCIAIIVFSVIEMIAFGASFPIGAFFIALANVQATDETTGETYTVPPGPRATITWIGLCIVLGVVWATVNFSLAIAQMCLTDKLLSLGQSRTFAVSASAVTVVTAMNPVQPGMVMAFPPPGGYGGPPPPPGYGYPGYPYPAPPPGWAGGAPPQQQGWAGAPGGYPGAPPPGYAPPSAGGGDTNPYSAPAGAYAAPSATSMYPRMVPSKDPA